MRIQVVNDDNMKPLYLYRMTQDEGLDLKSEVMLQGVRQVIDLGRTESILVTRNRIEPEPMNVGATSEATPSTDQHNPDQSASAEQGGGAVPEVVSPPEAGVRSRRTRGD